MPKLPIGDVFAEIIYFLSDALRELFDLIRLVVMSVVEGIEAALDFVPFWGVAILIAVLAYFLSGKGLALFSFAGVFLIANMGLWDQTISTLAIIITSTMISLLVGIPVGILSAKFEPANKVIRPVLDFMQTMPAFVYLIPAVFFFRLGVVPASIATIIFSMPPAIRLTNLGIRQVPEELIEAGHAFGANWHQMLFKIQLPQAMPTIMAGINQCIMLSLSMVVISSMIGGAGLGSVVLSGLSNLDIGKGFEGGLAVVIIAIILDRLTQGKSRKKDEA
ncbi:MAG: proline/glycine betaine ABC transporter permease [Eubacteriales bacterium]|nr:proline/glycine betaine ABC transporter permease [Eubacteriales bacterium]MDD4327098.1 proline/glycine betaine ABC transporter permease [Eubacteriales bacterium]MDD4717185.1 proline/glycine betaine ABC transporter permease [Eubacteriales bacterium]